MDGWGESRTVDEQIDAWQQELAACEQAITKIRARQVVLIRQLDRFQVDCGDGARTMGDWTSARLDLSQQTSNRLTQLAHSNDPEIDQAMSDGKWGLDRAAALVKLRHAGLPSDEFSEVAENYSLGRLYGLLDRLRHITPGDETDLFEYRYLVIQPSLDESVFKLWGALPGSDGRIIEKALTAREGEFPALPHQGQGQRRADALTAICLDSLTDGSEQGRAVTVAEVFIDAGLAARIVRRSRRHRLHRAEGGTQHVVRDSLHRPGTGDRHRRPPPRLLLRYGRSHPRPHPPLRRLAGPKPMFDRGMPQPLPAPTPPRPPTSPRRQP